MNDGITAYSSVGKSLLWHVIAITFSNAKLGIFPPNYAVMHSSLVSLLFIAWIPKIKLYTCDCSIRVTAVLEYLESAFHLVTISLCLHYEYS